MSDIVICCDGTWQIALDRSNVSRLHDALGPEVTPHYVKGVGTGGPLDRVRGGLTGYGLTTSLADGYAFVAKTYRPGDQISIFGFSRGAYTARSLAGMIGGVGIVDATELDAKQQEAAVKRAVDRYQNLKAAKKAQRELERDAAVRRLGPVPAAAPWFDGLRLSYDPAAPDTPIAFIGVWDTVGALGIPTYVGWPDLLRSRERFEFLDVTLDRRIPHARHAMSLDEMRGPFRPTLWDESSAPAAQDIKQVWFPGDHCDVGGGHRDDTGLSDGALRWMIDEAAKAVNLPFRQELVDEIIPAVGRERGRIHGMSGGLPGAAKEIALQPRPRAVPLVDRTRPLPTVHVSAYEMQEADPRYRRSRTLRPGETAELTVEADQGWNDTGLYLESGGEYRFTATGTWKSGVTTYGPDGRKNRFVGGLLGAGTGIVQGLLRFALNNPEVEVPGARREVDQPVMLLMALVANEVHEAVVHADGPRQDDDPRQDDKFVIGTRADVRPRGQGYLFAYANDAWGFYGNNDGALRLEISRTT